MARGINKVILVGNLGADPDARYMPSGSAVTNIRVATSESWKDKNTGDQQERTEWHNVAFFGRLAEIAAGKPETVEQCRTQGRFDIFPQMVGMDLYPRIEEQERRLAGGHDHRNRRIAEIGERSPEIAPER